MPINLNSTEVYLVGGMIVAWVVQAYRNRGKKLKLWDRFWDRSMCSLVAGIAILLSQEFMPNIGLGSCLALALICGSIGYSGAVNLILKMIKVPMPEELKDNIKIDQNITTNTYNDRNIINDAESPRLKKSKAKEPPGPIDLTK